ncbi:MAG: hypothetical protein J5958_07850 [Clostridia bacterium]|nr:hypothetical protein [Clostridia bacterium]
MKKRAHVTLIRKCGFRVEWEEDTDGSGRLFLFGVASFGAYEEKKKCFLTKAGKVSVYGERLSVETFRSGGVEVVGRIVGVSFAPGQEEHGFAAD